MAVTARQYRAEARCACKHTAGAHRQDWPGCAMLCPCPRFVPSWRERLRAAWEALRAARAALRGGL